MTLWPGAGDVLGALQGSTGPRAAALLSPLGSAVCAAQALLCLAEMQQDKVTLYFFLIKKVSVCS